MVKLDSVKTMTINERLKMLRTENGLTQAQLAQELHIGQTTVAAYEKSHDPNIYNLIAYAKFFHCSLDFLAGVQEDSFSPFILFSESERELVKTFRKLSPAAKKLALSQMKLLSESDLNDNQV